MEYAEFKSLRVGPRRRECVRKFLLSHPGIIGRIKKRLHVTHSAVSKVLHGHQASAAVEQALEIEQRQYRNAA